MNFILHSIRIIYPLMASFQYLKNKDNDSTQRVLKYWCINWLFSLIDWAFPLILNDWLAPVITIGIAFGMVYQKFNFSVLIFDKTIQPLIKSNEKSIESFFNFINSQFAKVWGKRTEVQDQLQTGVTNAVFDQLKKKN